MKDIGTINLESKRLIFRKLKESDAFDMYNNWCNCDDVTRYLPWNTHKSIEDTKEILNIWINDYQNPFTYRWIIIEKNDNTPIGTIDVVNKDIDNKVFEIGHCYSKKYWHQGYATESLSRIISFLFEETNVDLITAKHNGNNIASGKVMQKAGMKYDGTLRERITDKITGQKDSLVYYSITKEEYLKNKDSINNNVK